MNTTKPHTTLALLYPYYGRFPWYFKFFLHSCKHNPSVDFIFFTDITEIPYKGKLPANIIFHYLPFEDLKVKICEKLGFEVALPKPYKLCDFKPAYGKIFSDLLTQYDFWGHGDIDLIFGNIRNFITEELLENHDIISVRNEYISGFFTLFRNTNAMNNLFTHSKDYKSVFQNPRNMVFDECSNLFRELKSGACILELDSEVETMTHVVRKLQRANKIRAYMETVVVEGIPGKLHWNSGILSYKMKYEVLLYHFISFKNFPNYVPFFWRKIPDKFFIHKNYISSYTRDGFPYKLNHILISSYFFLIQTVKQVNNKLHRLKIRVIFFFNRGKYEYTEAKVITNNQIIVKTRLRKIT